MDPSDDVISVADPRRTRSLLGLPWWVIVGVVVTPIVLGVAVHPFVSSFVDWTMDGDLTPGVWEASAWLDGAGVVTMFAAVLASPVLVVLLVIVVAASFFRARRRPAGHCPACGYRLEAGGDICPECGPDAAVRSRTVPRWFVWSGWILGVPAAIWMLAALIGSSIAWVQLEREEDAFGRRTEAAAAAGALFYDERSRHGSLLGWTADRGYWSHRD